MRLKGLNLVPETFLETLNLLLERADFVFLVSIGICCASMADPATLMLTTRIHTSFLSKLISKEFNFSTKHGNFILSARLPILCSGIDKWILNEIEHWGLIYLLFLQRPLCPASTDTFLCLRKQLIRHPILMLIISIERNERTLSVFFL